MLCVWGYGCQTSIIFSFLPYLRLPLLSSNLFSLPFESTLFYSPLPSCHSSLALHQHYTNTHSLSLSLLLAPIYSSLFIYPHPFLSPSPSTSRYMLINSNNVFKFKKKYCIINVSILFTWSLLHWYVHLFSLCHGMLWHDLTWHEMKWHDIAQQGWYGMEESSTLNDEWMKGGFNRDRGSCCVTHFLLYIFINM